MEGSGPVELATGRAELVIGRSKLVIEPVKLSIESLKLVRTHRKPMIERVKDVIGRRRS